MEEHESQCHIRVHVAEGIVCPAIITFSAYAVFKRNDLSIETLQVTCPDILVASVWVWFCKR